MLHPPKKENLFETIIFRNDDVGYDTDVERFIDFCELFHKYGFVQLHGISLYGKMNDTILVDGIPWMYEEILPDEIYDYEKCVSVSKDYIGDNERLVGYLNSIPDPIALHGLYHSDYSGMSYEQQEHDIKRGLELLQDLFPNKTVDTFIAPFNRTNENTYKVCEKYGLRISAIEGEHLEDRLDNGKGPLYDGELYRYHHHRFYPESTFNYYDLSVKRLEEYFNKYSFNMNYLLKRVVPSDGMIGAVCRHYGYNVNDEKNYESLWKTELSIHNSVDKSEKILLVDCIDILLPFKLWASGYTDVEVLDADDKKISVLKSISKLINAEIVISKGDLNAYDGIISTVVYQGDNFEKVFDGFARRANSYSRIIVVTSAANEELVIDAASYINARLINVRPYSQFSSSSVYVFERKKPKVCLYCDRPNWAHDNSAQVIKRYLLDEFDIDIRYVVNQEDYCVDDYDAFLVFFWGEKSYKKEKYSKSRIIKQVSSHRWQYDAPYGPIEVEQFRDEYLSDAASVICPSKILYDMLKPYVKNLFLCGKGYDSGIFFPTKKRSGEMKLCMVGNLADPVKGVEDLLKPAAEGYHIDLAKDIKHEELNDFYNQHDVYVVSSVHEADPLPLIESMACGCFPVASRIGIAPELIRHKENGYLVEERTVDEFKKAFEWCHNNLKYIRSKSSEIAEEMKSHREWLIMVENYRVMLRKHIGRR